MRSNAPDPQRGLSTADAPEEFARQAIIRALEQALWTFGVDHDSIFVTKMCRALGISALRRELPVRQFPCEAGCGREVITTAPNQRFCSPLCCERARRQRHNATAEAHQ